MKSDGQLVRNEGMRVMWKPYNTRTSVKISSKPLNIQGLCERGSAVLSGSKAPKRVYLETV
jgi:hypothetical protein